ncbi:MAG: tetratricopeptide repeat protein, partial [Gallionella sp.]
LLIRRPSLALLRQIAPYYILSSVVAIILLLSVKGMLGHAYEPNAAGILDISARKQGLTALPNIHLLSIFTQSGLFFKYLGLWLVPDPAWMSVDMREPFATGLLSWPYTLGMIAFLAYPCLALWLLLKRGSLGLLGFALLFPWIMYFTEFSTVRIQEPFVLYRSYLWMPGVFAALPVLLGRLSRRSAFILLCIVVLSLIPLTLNRLQTFSSTLNLWDDAEKLVRDKRNVFGAERIYYNRGTELGQLKRYREAVADFSTAIAIYPFDFIYGNRATAYYFLGEYQHALHDFDRAIELDPDNATSYYGRAMTYRVLGDFKAAQDDLRKSCSLGLCPQG